jgi:hypothetical protein
MCVALDLSLLQSRLRVTHPDLATAGASNKHSSWMRSSIGWCCAAAGPTGLLRMLLLLQHITECSKQRTAAADGWCYSSYRSTRTVLLCGTCSTSLSNKCCCSS